MPASQRAAGCVHLCTANASDHSPAFQRWRSTDGRFRRIIRLAQYTSTAGIRGLLMRGEERLSVLLLQRLQTTKRPQYRTLWVCARLPVQQRIAIN